MTNTALENENLLSKFIREFGEFKAKHAEVLEGMSTIVQTALPPEKRLFVDDFIRDQVDKLMDALSAQAANTVDDDEAAQEEAIAEIEIWVVDNVHNADLVTRMAALLWNEGAERGHRRFMEDFVKTPVRLRLVLDVAYEPEGPTPGELTAGLRSRIEGAIGRGLLTEGLDVSVDSYRLAVQETVELPSVRDLVPFLAQRITQEWEPDDIPIRLARYGLMDPSEFAQEMRERMQGNDEDLGG